MLRAPDGFAESPAFYRTVEVGMFLAKAQGRKGRKEI